MCKGPNDSVARRPDLSTLASGDGAGDEGGLGCTVASRAAGGAQPERGSQGARRDTYLKIKVKIKHLQELNLRLFLVKIKHSLDMKFSKFDKKLKMFL